MHMVQNTVDLPGHQYIVEDFWVFFLSDLSLGCLVKFTFLFHVYF